MSLAATRTILVPTDFSAASEEAVRAAIELALTWGAAIELLHVTVDATYIAVPQDNTLALPIEVSEATKAENSLLEAAAARVRRWRVECRTSTAIGKTHVEIVEQAIKIGAGLIAMGSHDRHGIGSTLLGSVAEKVLRHAPCPILVVPLVAGSAEERVPDEVSLVAAPMAEAV